MNVFKAQKGRMPFHYDKGYRFLLELGTPRRINQGQVLIPVSGRVQLKGRGQIDAIWLHGARADTAGYI